MLAMDGLLLKQKPFEAWHALASGGMAPHSPLQVLYLLQAFAAAFLSRRSPDHCWGTCDAAPWHLCRGHTHQGSIQGSHKYPGG